MRSQVEDKEIKYRNDYLRKIINDSQIKRQKIKLSTEIDVYDVPPLAIGNKKIYSNNGC